MSWIKATINYGFFMIKRHLKDISILKWVIFSLGILFYFYEFFIRVSPSIIVNDLMTKFHINAATVGFISAFYFYLYAVMQVPVGVMMDRFGARSLLTIGAISCGLGAILFGVATSTLMLSLGRALQGIGSAFAFLGMVYICSHWFHSSKLAFLVGLGNSIGMLGAAAGEGPLSSFNQLFGWRTTINTFGIMGILLGLFILFIVRNEPEGVEKKLRKKQKLKDLHIGDHLKTVFKNPHSWIISFICFSIYATTTAFAGLWGVPFLEKAYGVSNTVASYALSTFFLGWIVGGPIIGLISDKIKNRKIVFIFSGLINAGLISSVIYYQLPSIYLVYVILFFVGFFSSSQNLTYCVAIEINPVECKGTAIATTNFINFAFGSLIQPLVGFLLSLHWKGALSNGIAVYSTHNYRFALMVFPISFLVSALLSLFLKERKDQVKKNVIKA